MKQLKIVGQKPAPGQFAIVAGAGRSGIAAARLLRKILGTRVRLVDNNPDALSANDFSDLNNIGIEVVLGNQDSANFENASLIVTSPGFPIRKLHELLLDTSSIQPEIISETELAWRCLDDEPVLLLHRDKRQDNYGILAAAMLETQGIKMSFFGET